MADTKISALPLASTADGGEFVIASGGANYKAIGGAANGVATLDSAGKLVQPRRVLDIRAPGISRVTTTASVDNAPVVGQVSIPAENYIRHAILQAVIQVHNNDTASLSLSGQFVLSTDGGVTWYLIAKGVTYSPLPAGQYLPYPMSPRRFDLTAGVSYKLGLRLGTVTATGQSITVYESTYSSFIITLVDY